MMDKLFNDDGSFAAPRYVADINQVPESHRDWYARHGSGEHAFKLIADVWNELEPLRKQVEDLETELKEAPAKFEARAVAERAAHKQERIERRISSTLLAAGVRPGLVAGAAALVTQGVTFEIEEGYEGGDYVVLGTRDGALYSTDLLVERFLDSDEGAAWRGKPAATPSDGYFTGLMADLKQRR